MIHNAEEYECRNCGENFEPGDEMVEVWSDAEVDEDGSWEGQNCDIYHGECVVVKDGRPPAVRYVVYENRGGRRVLHIRSVSGRSRCGALDISKAEAESEHADPGDIAEEEDAELCSTCARSFRRDHL